MSSCLCALHAARACKAEPGKEALMQVQVAMLEQALELAAPSWLHA